MESVMELLMLPVTPTTVLSLIGMLLWWRAPCIALVPG